MKYLKKLTAALGLLFALCAFMACGGASTYTVTVDCEESFIFAGLQVQLSDENGVVASKDIPDDGKVTFDLDGGTYEARIVEKAGFEGMLLDYVYEIKTLTEDARSATVRITPIDEATDGQEKIVYKVTATLPDGTPVKDVTVQLCGGPAGSCYSGKTDENGVATLELAAGDYDVHIEPAHCPEGYTFNNDTYKMGSTGGSLTVKFEKA